MGDNEMAKGDIMRRPKYLAYARYFFAGAIAVSMTLDYFGLFPGFGNLGVSSIGGIGALLVAKKMALIV